MKTHLPGVYQTVKKDGSVSYRSSITVQNRHISLGSFSDPEKAHQAYREARSVISDKSVVFLSFPEFSALPFEKFVSLLNFRDNGLYIATPVYIRRKYFEYHLDADTVLKFDMDDLFFYSSHKIMRRGGHLFVSDYGMQVSLASRYGVKAYGIKDRDYRFVNGDPLDFRYENIEIKNGYHGVVPALRRGRECYKAKIHVRGDYVIGYYPSAQEAAIAYNKAVDLLKKAGLQKRYASNYMENMSPFLYADLYSKIKISKKLLAFCENFSAEKKAKEPS